VGLLTTGLGAPGGLAEGGREEFRAVAGASPRASRSSRSKECHLAVELADPGLVPQPPAAQNPIAPAQLGDAERQLSIALAQFQAVAADLRAGRGVIHDLPDLWPGPDAWQASMLNFS